MAGTIQKARAKVRVVSGYRTDTGYRILMRPILGRKDSVGLYALICPAFKNDVSALGFSGTLIAQLLRNDSNQGVSIQGNWYCFADFTGRRRSFSRDIYYGKNGLGKPLRRAVYRAVRKFAEKCRIPNSASYKGRVVDVFLNGQKEELPALSRKGVGGRGRLVNNTSIFG